MLTKTMSAFSASPATAQRGRSGRKHPIHSFLSTFLALTITGGAWVTTAQAQTVTLEPTARGRINSLGNNSFLLSPRITSYVAGDDVGASERGFLVYALPAAPAGQQVVAARLRLYTGPAGHAITGGAQTVSFRHTPEVAVAALTFADLDDDPVVGTQVYMEADDIGGYKEIQLNAAGVAALNSRLGQSFTLGATSSGETTGAEVFVNTRPPDLGEIKLIRV
jgi:hypothetical protein